jgi:hypothetical protein
MGQLVPLCRALKVLYACEQFPIEHFVQFEVGPIQPIGAFQYGLCDHSDFCCFGMVLVTNLTPGSDSQNTS